MNKEELVLKLKELAEGTRIWHGYVESQKYDEGFDPSEAHKQADELLLSYIGEEDVTRAYDTIIKWYD